MCKTQHSVRRRGFCEQELIGRRTTALRSLPTDQGDTRATGRSANAHGARTRKSRLAAATYEDFGECAQQRRRAKIFENPTQQLAQRSRPLRCGRSVRARQRSRSSGTRAPRRCCWIADAYWRLLGGSRALNTLGTSSAASLDFASVYERRTFPRPLSFALTRYAEPSTPREMPGERRSPPRQLSCPLVGRREVFCL